MSLSDAEVGSGSFRTAILAYDSGLVIALSGELDLAGVPTFQAALDAVRDADAAVVVLDFTELEFIDSSGISAIVSALGTVDGTDRRMVVCGIHGQVQRVLELVDLLPRLTLVERPRDAVAWPPDVD